VQFRLVTFIVPSARDSAFQSCTNSTKQSARLFPLTSPKSFLVVLDVMGRRWATPTSARGGKCGKAPFVRVGSGGSRFSDCHLSESFSRFLPFWRHSEGEPLHICARDRIAMERR
jgi:hypothetical protein